MSSDSQEIWVLTTYLETERGGSLRQERWCQVFLKEKLILRIFNLHGAFHFTEATCLDEKSFNNFRRGGIAKYGVTHSSVRENRTSQILRKIKHFLMVDLYFPNVITAFFKAIYSLSTRSQPVRIIASSPSFSVALIGALLKFFYTKKVVLAIDMRDAWAWHPALGGIRLVKVFIERWVLRRADFVSTVSIGLAEEFEKNYKIKVHVLYNVASHYASVASAVQTSISTLLPMARPSSLKIIYTGSTPENFYDIETFTAALAILEAEHPNVSEKLQIVFIGSCDEVRIAAARNGVSNDLLLFSQHLPNYQVRSLQIAADALLFLGFDGEKNMGVVSTKFFEYLSLGRPILPINVFADSDVHYLLKRYCSKSKNIHTAHEISNSLAEIATSGTSHLPTVVDTQCLQELMSEYHQYAQKLFKHLN